MNISSAIEKLKSFTVPADVYELLIKTSDSLKALSDSVSSINRRVWTLEDTDKSRKDALESMVFTEGIEAEAWKCEDCNLMRLELDGIKKRLEALELKRPARRKSDAK